MKCNHKIVIWSTNWNDTEGGYTPPLVALCWGCREVRYAAVVTL